MSVANKLYVRKVQKAVYEIYGVLEGRFVKRVYVGYSEKQAKEKFQQSAVKGEL